MIAAVQPPLVSAPPAAALDGTVERITFYNPQNGFTVLRLRTRSSREPVDVVGNLPAVQPGEVLSLRGRWQTDPVHGAQFRLVAAEVRPPAALDDVVRYLGSGLIRQLGPVLAQRIVDTFGERTLEILDAQPHRVREVPGIGPQRAQSLAAAWKEHRALRAVAAFLSEHGLHTGFAPRLVRAYGDDAPRVLAANPYRLVAEVPGLGFASADRLGRDLVVRPTSPARLQAAVHAALLRASDQGHTRMDRATLVEAAATLANVDAEHVAPAIIQLLSSGVIATSPAASGSVSTLPSPSLGEGPGVRAGRAVRGAADCLTPYVSPLSGDVHAAPRQNPRLRVFEPRTTYDATPDSASDLGLGLAGLVRAEEALAEQLSRLAHRQASLHRNVVDSWLGSGQYGELSDEQRQAVRAAATSGCFVLTGGPGVGKTTTVRALVACLRAAGREVALAAPTGKAAKRLGEVVGLEAKTIHRLLGAGPEGFRFGTWEPLPFDAVIVDEASMLDTQLARSVVAAIGSRTQLILVGDADQLPSVGPGQVLRDLLASGAVPSTTLRTVFRQAAQSEIVRAAHAIREGHVPNLAPHAALARGTDLVFVPCAAAGLPQVAAEWAASRLPAHLRLPPHEVQVLAPLTRVTQAINGLLQERLNPARGQAERPHGALPLRSGDRVIQTRNNYQLGVFNGDTGVITEVESDAVRVDFADGRVVAYAPADVLDLDHAYCLTVHRAQGSEWPGVVVMASSSYGPMLTRNLLYTALTRARRAAVIVGDTAAIERAVADTRDQQRHTGLAGLLRNALDAA